MKFKTIEEIFKAFSKLKVLIIGDVMVDIYDWGKVERISPEAPVPVIALTNSELRLGGASNVALNIQALGAIPVLCSVIGNDGEGKDFLRLLKKNKMSVEGIVSSERRVTTSKRRVMAGSQHLLRIDHEDTESLHSKDSKELLLRVGNLLKGTDVVIFEDYDKGVIDPSLIRQVVKLCKQKNIPIAVDPKKRNFLDYASVSLFKPNLKELKEGLKIELNAANTKELDLAVSKLHESIRSDKYLITLSEKGVYVKSGSKSTLITAHIREIADVSGAGDTVISVAALCLALDLPNRLLAELSNLAGGLVCEHVGVVPITKDDLLTEAKKHIKISEQ